MYCLDRWGVADTRYCSSRVRLKAVLDSNGTTALQSLIEPNPNAGRKKERKKPFGKFPWQSLWALSKWDKQMGVFLLGTLNSLFYPISYVHPPLVVNSEFMVNSKPDNTGLFWWTLQMSFSEHPYIELLPGTLLGVGVKLLTILLCCLVTWRSNHMDVLSYLISLYNLLALSR